MHGWRKRCCFRSMQDFGASRDLWAELCGAMIRCCCFTFLKKVLGFNCYLELNFCSCWMWWFTDFPLAAAAGSHFFTTVHWVAIKWGSNIHDHLQNWWPCFVFGATAPSRTVDSQSYVHFQFHPFSVFLLMINVKMEVTLLDVYTLQKWQICFVVASL